ncbi:MAG: hypothetical protein H6712_13200 [Myxococcales bacterium]|nr:hypothetical protein [Myxococcales bacterium]MCB9714817.1 hypothetical protein [Myxococcales bacterium]
MAPLEPRRGPVEPPWPARAWHGLDWSLVRTGDGARGERLQALVTGPIALDRHGVDEAWGLRSATHRRTIVRGIERRPPDELPTMDARNAPALARAPVPPTMDAHAASPAAREAIFEAAVARLAAQDPTAALALGGGIDAAAVLVAWHRLTGRWPVVVTLRTGLPDYDELTATHELCARLGAPLEAIDVPPSHLLAGLSAAVAAAQCPLYDLHPVGRLGLARALRARGHRTLVTGDGADAAFRGRPDYDYVPIVAALTEAAGLRACSPFWDDAVLGSLRASGPDPDKAWLRAYLERRGVPSRLARRPKRSRRLGALGLHPDPAALHPLAAALDRPLHLRTERARVSWATLHRLVSMLEEGTA